MLKNALDAGHYLGTAGKRIPKSLDANETREWVLNDRVADQVELLLEGYAGYELLRVDDPIGKKEISTKNRAKAANDFGADIYISLHHNAGIKGGNGFFMGQRCSLCKVELLILQKVELFLHR